MQARVKKAAKLANYHLYLMFSALTKKPRVLPLKHSGFKGKDFVLDPVVYQEGNHKATMPVAFVHEMLDLIVLGRVYRHVHKRKDEHAQRVPGLRHREIGHEWYQLYGSCWNLESPFPAWRIMEIQKIRRSDGVNAAEERMASDGHDLLDRTWDRMAKPQREYWEGFFVWLLYSPDLLSLGPESMFCVGACPG